MNKRGWSARIVMKYVLLQAHEVSLLILILILVRCWVDVPTRFIWGLIALWVAKDVILFPFVWPAYDRECTQDTNSMVGMRGIAEDRLDPIGYIRAHGELWEAEVIGDGPPVERGEGVKVRGTRNLTLLVQPNNEKKTE